MAIETTQGSAEVPALPQVKLIESDGEPLESEWHRLAMNVLIESLKPYLMQQRDDFYAGGNMYGCTTNLVTDSDFGFITLGVSNTWDQIWDDPEYYDAWRTELPANVVAYVDSHVGLTDLCDAQWAEGLSEVYLITVHYEDCEVTGYSVEFGISLGYGMTYRMSTLLDANGNEWDAYCWA